jgi:hypothetical protein
MFNLPHPSTLSTIVCPLDIVLDSCNEICIAMLHRQIVTYREDEDEIVKSTAEHSN